MRHLLPPLLLLLVLTSCGSPEKQFAKLAEEFVYTSLAMSPVTAAASGLHQYQGKNLDDLLDDMGTESLGRQRAWYGRFGERLQREVKRDGLGPEDRVDYDIIRGQIALAILEFDEIQSHLHNPTGYVEMLGNALFTPYVLNYAPQPERIRHIISRLQKVPLFIDQAKTNLTQAPDIWTKVAQEENAGNIDLIDKTIRASVPADQKEAYDRAAKSAIAAIQDFQTYLQSSLAPRNNANWRLGAAKYTKKFQYVLGTDQGPSEVLAQAEKDIASVRARMLQIALPLHQNQFAAHKDHAAMPQQERENAIIGEVLDSIANRHATPETYMPEAKADLDEARQFVQQKKFLTLPASGNLQVIDTPEFMRGIYAVGGFAPAPPLEPQLGAFYWVTPIPKDWPRERVESKLREYNFYKLKLLTIHEAMPGHYVQLEYANAIPDKTRRLIRSVYGNGPYIEGWAQYITKVMLDEGFLNHSAELQLTFLKEALRVLANAVLDVRLQMLDMTDQDALDLMQRMTFQEKEEATAKLQRAKLSSAQLPTYYVGWLNWLRVRALAKEKQANFSMTGFHDRALKEGAVPLPSLAELLTGQSLAGRPAVGLE